MLINAKKCQCIVLRPQYCKLEVQLVKCLVNNDVAVPWLTRVNHLGNIVNFDDLGDVFDIQNKRGCFIGAVNSAVAALSRLPVTHRANVFNTYCMPLYGCQQWNLSHNNIIQLEIS